MLSFAARFWGVNFVDFGYHFLSNYAISMHLTLSELKSGKILAKIKSLNKIQVDQCFQSGVALSDKYIFNKILLINSKEICPLKYYTSAS